MGLVFYMLFLFHFSRNSFFVIKKYISMKIEVKQNGTPKSWPFTEIVWEVELERSQKCLKTLLFIYGIPEKNIVGI